MININFKINIPFTKKYLKIKRTSGGNVNNGNGFKHKTIEFSLFTIIGNGDSGIRSIK